MADDDPDKIGKLLEEARARPPGQREAFLEEQCEDEALRREIASLLAAYEEAPHLVEGIADAVVDPALSAFERPEGGAARGADPLGLVGTQVRRYVVEEVLGGGGMGIVYRACDRRLDRDVALKFLPPFLVSNPEAEERFVREAQAAASLDHTNVATVHEIGRVPGGEAQGLRFIAMEYYGGETLRSLLDREGPLPLETVLDYAAQICEGLQAAHDAGIVHRDVKPANVMITDKGTVKLLDFGLARAAGQSRITASGQQPGTMAYMSPEQIEDDPVDARTDLWALGALLYEMLAGRRPFRERRRASLLRAILHEEPDPLTEHRPEVPSALATLVHRCLRKDPAERPSSAAAVRADLRALGSAKDAGASGTGPPERARPAALWSRWAAGAAALLVLGAALAWAVWPREEAEEASPADSGGPSSIAVLPFEVSGTGAEAWRDGMVTMLSMNLDGIAGLRAVADRRVFAAAHQVDSAAVGPDGSPALATARRTGATYAVVGSAVQLGQTLRLGAEVRKVQSGNRLGRVEVEGAPDRVTALTDALTRRIVGLLVEEREADLPPVNLASITTGSLNALKHYLDGERHFRTGAYEAAAADYEAAVGQDSTFALAYLRLAQTMWWMNDWGWHGMVRRAYELSDQLPRRERRIVRALHLRFNRRRHEAAADTLQALTEDYPEDPAVWYALGELTYFRGIPGGLPAAEAAYEQAVALDPGVAQYHHHLVELAFTLHDDSALAARRIRAHPPGVFKQMYRWVLNYAYGTPETRQAALQRLSRLPPDTNWPFYDLRRALRHPTHGPLEANVLRRLLKREDIDRGFYRGELIDNLLGRGQVDEAVAQIRERDLRAPWAECKLAQSVSLGIPVPDSIFRQLAPSNVANMGSDLEVMCGAGIYLTETGRPEEIPALVRRFQEAAAADGPSEEQIQAATNELRGYRAWRNGEWERAQAFWDGQNAGGAIGAIWRGDLYRRLGRLEEAEGWYLGAWGHPVAHERLGRLYQKMGKPEKAKAAYERFVDAWDDADPELQPRVERARKQIETIGRKEVAE